MEKFGLSIILARKNKQEGIFANLEYKWHLVFTKNRNKQNRTEFCCLSNYKYILL